jgi:transcriptional regulator NrdR family protein
MVCIYCGGKTQVTNSRPQKRLNHTWRRRECLACHAIFTTEESAQLGTSLVVRPAAHGRTAPFSRDKLFASLLRAVGHRKAAVDDASALCATIIAKLLHSTDQAAVSPQQIITISLDVLKNFDNAAAVQYQAYHQN